MAPQKQQLRAEISNAARNGYPFYVYALSDSRGVFYIGKGTKDRVFSHVSQREATTNQAKKARLMASGNIEHVALAYFREQGDAYRHEAVLIRGTEGLTNIALGDWLEPVDRARADARTMLERLVPFEQWQPTKAIAIFQKFLGAASLREAYDWTKAEILKQIESPAPTTIIFDKEGCETGRRYNERHGARLHPRGGY